MFPWTLWHGRRGKTESLGQTVSQQNILRDRGKKSQNELPIKDRAKQHRKVYWFSPAPAWLSTLNPRPSFTLLFNGEHSFWKPSPVFTSFFSFWRVNCPTRAFHSLPRVSKTQLYCLFPLLNHGLQVSLLTGIPFNCKYPLHSLINPISSALCNHYLVKTVSKEASSDLLVARPRGIFWCCTTGPFLPFEHLSSAGLQSFSLNSPHTSTSGCDSWW